MKPKSWLVLFALFSTTANAHMLWIEQNSTGSSKMYFGEYADGIKEAQQGALKNFADLKVYQTGKVFDGKAEEDHFSFDTVQKADVRLSSKRVHKNMLVVFDAKAGRQETSAAEPLSLEFLPQEPQGNKLCLFFQNEPVPKAEVSLVAPNLWSKTLHTDEQGCVNLITPWSGLYLLETVRLVEKPGSFADKPYEKIRYVHTVTLQAP